jgi:hypothetical protein
MLSGCTNSPHLGHLTAENIVLSRWVSRVM